MPALRQNGGPGGNACPVRIAICSGSSSSSAGAAPPSPVTYGPAPSSNTLSQVTGARAVVASVLLLFSALFFINMLIAPHRLASTTGSPYSILSGDGGSGVTMDEYNQIENGMSYEQVTGILGSPGVQQSENQLPGVAGYMPSITTVMYMWQNGDGSNMNVMFQNDKMVQKGQFGLR